MDRLRRKIDQYLIDWKNSSNKMPLIIKGARQIGKTNAIRNFGEKNYKTFIEINFVFQPEFKTIFEDGFVVDNIVKNITLKMPEIQINEYDTLIFFDEMQECVSTATSLKAFREDGRYDVICSGSLMEINYYAGGLDKTKILNCYKKIPVFLGNENKKILNIKNC